MDVIIKTTKINIPFIVALGVDQAESVLCRMQTARSTTLCLLTLSSPQAEGMRLSLNANDIGPSSAQGVKALLQKNEAPRAH